MSTPKFESLEEYLNTQPLDLYEPDKHDKGWGYELWIVNTPVYCGKVLVLLRSKKCSMHFHVAKDETFHVIRGEIKLNLIYKDGKQKSLVMREGDSFHVPPGLMHQFEGIASETHIVEFSTQHYEEDSYRIERGD